MLSDPLVERRKVAPAGVTGDEVADCLRGECTEPDQPATRGGDAEGDGEIGARERAVAPGGLAGRGDGANEVGEIIGRLVRQTPVYAECLQ